MTTGEARRAAAATLVPDNQDGPQRMLEMPEVRDIPRAQAMMAAPSTPEEFAALIKSDGERYRRIIREANVRVE